MQKEVAITNMGVGLPLHRHSQIEVVDFLTKHFPLTENQKRKLKTVYLSSNIEARYSVIPHVEQLPQFFNLPGEDKHCFNTKERMAFYQKNALPLAIQAIENCIGLDVSKITHLITVSCTGMYAPGIDVEMVHHLKLPSSTHRLCINFMGCYGVFNALKMAQSICQANVKASVLIVSVEMCSLHFQTLQSLDGLISSAIFSDGAGALLVQANSEEDKRLVCNDFYCDLMPQGKEAMTWDIGNYGFDIMLSSYVPKLIHLGIRQFIEKLFDRNAISFEQCHHYAIHPGGKKILEACALALKLNADNLRPSYQVLEQYGNMSSATIVFVLKKIWDTLKKEPCPEKIFGCAFGPGLTLESMLLTAYV